MLIPRPLLPRSHLPPSHLPRHRLPPSRLPRLARLPHLPHPHPPRPHFPPRPCFPRLPRPRPSFSHSLLHCRYVILTALIFPVFLDRLLIIISVVFHTHAAITVAHIFVPIPFFLLLLLLSPFLFGCVFCLFFPSSSSRSSFSRRFRFRRLASFGYIWHPGLRIHAR